MRRSSCRRRHRAHPGAASRHRAHHLRSRRGPAQGMIDLAGKRAFVTGGAGVSDARRRSCCRARARRSRSVIDPGSPPAMRTSSPRCAATSARRRARRKRSPRRCERWRRAGHSRRQPRHLAAGRRARCQAKRRAVGNHAPGESRRRDLRLPRGHPEHRERWDDRPRRLDSRPARRGVPRRLCRYEGCRHLVYQVSGRRIGAQDHGELRCAGMGRYDMSAATLKANPRSSPRSPSAAREAPRISRVRSYFCARVWRGTSRARF